MRTMIETAERAVGHHKNAVRPLLYDVDATSRALCVSERRVWELLAAAELESTHIGRKRMIFAASIEAYVDRLPRVRAAA
jgi:hypothetical protein